MLDWSRALAALVCIALLGGCSSQRRETPQPLDDEAMVRARRAGLTPADAAKQWFPPSPENYFAGMDQIAVSPSAVSGNAVNPFDVPVYQLLDHATPASALVDPHLTASERIGQNAWMMWAGGNEGFWDWLGLQFGFIDLLKLLDTDTRTTRFRDGGLINEPGMVRGGLPGEDEFGLRLDQPADPRIRAWRQAYLTKAFSDGGVAPGDPIAYYKGVPNPQVYGLSSGIVGLRLFPNPKFDADARRKWNAATYYNDPAGNAKMIRPFRVGMSCAFCHASFHPLRPPADVTAPAWENISGNIGSQYLRIRAVFGNLLPKNNFVYHLLDSQPPGTIDTSLIASDNINNPNTMNAVFKLPQRLGVAFKNPKEKQSEVSAHLPSAWQSPEASESSGAPDPVPDALRQIFDAAHLGMELNASNSNPRRVPRILLDGADSIGGWGALARVYLNIGTSYEQWNQLHLPVVGFQPQRSFLIQDLEQHSVYWQATKLRVPHLRDYFLKVTPSMPLVDARAPASSDTDADRAQRVTRIDPTKLARGRKVFAQNCIVCHSSIQPLERHAAMEASAALGEYWDHDPGQWLADPSYMKWALEQVEKPEFWRDNYLSTDYRIAINLVETNACRAVATNAMTGRMWQDFASESYRSMPSVGAIRFFNPFSGDQGSEAWFSPRHKTQSGVPAGGGGPGFYRVPTLVSVWATAPFFHNNSLGAFNNDPSIDGRLAAFDDAIRKLLWPERRLWSSSYNDATASRLRADHGLIWRTTEDTYLHIGSRYVPGLVGFQSALARMLDARLPMLKDRDPRWAWVPSAVLMLIALAGLVLAPSIWIRLASYVVILAAIALGAVTYFLNGGLGDIHLGPIPKGTPVNLLANINPETDEQKLKDVLRHVKLTLTEIESSKLDREAAWNLLRERVAPELVEISKCPDFVMDHGHYYEWFKKMSDDDKVALIELLKTF